MSILNAIKRNNEVIQLNEKQATEKKQLVAKQDKEVRQEFLAEAKEFLDTLKELGIEYRMQEYNAPLVQIDMMVCKGMWLHFKMCTDTKKQQKPYGVEYKSSYSCSDSYKYYATFEEMILEGLNLASKDKNSDNNFDKIYSI